MLTTLKRATFEPERSTTSPADGLRRSRFAPLLRSAYQLFGCHRRWTIARFMLLLINRLEGGAISSATSRELMSKYHEVEIGAYSYGDCFDPATMPKGTFIGRYVSIARGVRMFMQNHPVDRLSTHPFFYEQGLNGAAIADEPTQLVIGHDVWIGCNAIITPGCRRVGNGAVIGAGAVVTKDVPDFAIVAGSPARKIRDRFPTEVQQRLLASNWWLLPSVEVAARRDELDGLLVDSHFHTANNNGQTSAENPRAHSMVLPSS
ncbi:MAG TPA: CatB-related O-acetyltransferase [Schlesneria sp.]